MADKGQQTKTNDGKSRRISSEERKWRSYSKSLIEELKEKLAARRARTLGLLAEGDDLSAFCEVDTESDGLDDTSSQSQVSTGIVARARKSLQDAHWEHGAAVTAASISETSTLSDMDFSQHLPTEFVEHHHTMDAMTEVAGICDRRRSVHCTTTAMECFSFSPPLPADNTTNTSAKFEFPEKKELVSVAVECGKSIMDIAVNETISAARVFNEKHVDLDPAKDSDSNESLSFEYCYINAMKECETLYTPNTSNFGCEAMQLTETLDIDFLFTSDKSPTRTKRSPLTKQNDETTRLVVENAESICPRQEFDYEANVGANVDLKISEYSRGDAFFSHREKHFESTSNANVQLNPNDNKQSYSCNTHTTPPLFNETKHGSFCLQTLTPDHTSEERENKIEPSNTDKENKRPFLGKDVTKSISAQTSMDVCHEYGTLAKSFGGAGDFTLGGKKINRNINICNQLSDEAERLLTLELSFTTHKCMVEEIIRIIKSNHLFNSTVDTRTIGYVTQLIPERSTLSHSNRNVSSNSRNYDTDRQNKTDGPVDKNADGVESFKRRQCLQACLRKARLVSALQVNHDSAVTKMGKVVTKQAYERAVREFECLVTRFATNHGDLGENCHSLHTKNDEHPRVTTLPPFHTNRNSVSSKTFVCSAKNNQGSVEAGKESESKVKRCDKFVVLGETDTSENKMVDDDTQENMQTKQSNIIGSKCNDTVEHGIPSMDEANDSAIKGDNTEVTACHTEESDSESVESQESGVWSNQKYTSSLLTQLLDYCSSQEEDETHDTVADRKHSSVQKDETDIGCIENISNIEITTSKDNAVHYLVPETLSTNEQNQQEKDIHEMSIAPDSADIRRTPGTQNEVLDIVGVAKVVEHICLGDVQAEIDKNKVITMELAEEQEDTSRFMNSAETAKNYNLENEQFKSLPEEEGSRNALPNMTDVVCPLETEHGTDEGALDKSPNVIVTSSEAADKANPLMKSTHASEFVAEVVAQDDPNIDASEYKSRIVSEDNSTSGENDEKLDCDIESVNETFLANMPEARYIGDIDFIKVSPREIEEDLILYGSDFETGSDSDTYLNTPANMNGTPDISKVPLNEPTYPSTKGEVQPDGIERIEQSTEDTKPVGQYNSKISKGERKPPLVPYDPLFPPQSSNMTSHVDSATVEPDSSEHINLSYITSQSQESNQGTSNVTMGVLDNEQIQGAGSNSLLKPQASKQKNRKLVPKLDWSSSDDDTDDISSEIGPSELLRQRQIEQVDGQLQHLKEITKRKRKSRSPHKRRSLAEQKAKVEAIPEVDDQNESRCADRSKLRDLLQKICGKEGGNELPNMISKLHVSNSVDDKDDDPENKFISKERKDDDITCEKQIYESCKIQSDSPEPLTNSLVDEKQTMFDDFCNDSTTQQGGDTTNFVVNSSSHKNVEDSARCFSANFEVINKGESNQQTAASDITFTPCSYTKQSTCVEAITGEVDPVALDNETPSINVSSLGLNRQDADNVKTATSVDRKSHIPLHATDETTFDVKVLSPPNLSDSAEQKTDASKYKHYQKDVDSFVTNFDMFKLSREKQLNSITSTEYQETIHSMSESTHCLNNPCNGGPSFCYGRDSFETESIFTHNQVQQQDVSRHIQTQGKSGIKKNNCYTAYVHENSQKSSIETQTNEIPLGCVLSNLRTCMPINVSIASSSDEYTQTDVLNTSLPENLKDMGSREETEFVQKSFESDTEQNKMETQRLSSYMNDKNTNEILGKIENIERLLNISLSREAKTLSDDEDKATCKVTNLARRGGQNRTTVDHPSCNYKQIANAVSYNKQGSTKSINSSGYHELPSFTGNYPDLDNFDVGEKRQEERAEKKQIETSCQATVGVATQSCQTEEEKCSKKIDSAAIDTFSKVQELEHTLRAMAEDVAKIKCEVVQINNDNHNQTSHWAELQQRSKDFNNRQANNIRDVELKMEHQARHLEDSFTSKLLAATDDVKETILNEFKSELGNILKKVQAEIKSSVKIAGRDISEEIEAVKQALEFQSQDASMIKNSLNKVMLKLQNKRREETPTKSHQGMDVDTMKMRILELTAQRDSEKVFHKITRESLRALERDHDRLRDEYFGARLRRDRQATEQNKRQSAKNAILSKHYPCHLNVANPVGHPTTGNTGQDAFKNNHLAFSPTKSSNPPNRQTVTVLTDPDKRFSDTPAVADSDLIVTNSSQSNYRPDPLSTEKSLAMVVDRVDSHIEEHKGEAPGFRFENPN